MQIVRRGSYIGDGYWSHKRNIFPDVWVYFSNEMRRFFWDVNCPYHSQIVGVVYGF